MSNITNLDEVRNAEAATRLTNDKTFADAVVAVEKQYLDAQLNLKDTDIEGIKSLRMGIKSLRLILQHLSKQIKNGELSAFELDQAKGKHPRRFF